MQGAPVLSRPQRLRAEPEWTGPRSLKRRLIISSVRDLLERQEAQDANRNQGERDQVAQDSRFDQYRHPRDKGDHRLY